MYAEQIRVYNGRKQFLMCQSYCLPVYEILALQIRHSRAELENVTKKCFQVN